MSRRPFVGSAGFNEDQLAAVAEKASPGAVAGVEASRVGALEPSPTGDQIGRGCLDEEVIMMPIRTHAQIRTPESSQHSPRVSKNRHSSAPSGEAKMRLR